MAKVHCGFVGRNDVACSVTDAGSDDFCEGCQTVICGLHTDAPWGEHDPSDHEECSVCGESGHFDGECDE